MFRGRVNPRLEPVVPLELISDKGEIHPVEVLLDTGFDGALFLPGELILRMGFPLFDDFVSTLADGTEINVTGYQGRVNWHGRQLEILVLQSQGEALLGMNLLWRNRITIDNYANGPVIVEELQ